MKMWMRKTLVALFTIATFGLISPPSALMTDKPSELSSSDKSPYTAVYDTSDATRSWELSQEDNKERVDPFEQYKQEVLLSAENQSFLKFGRKITPVIEDEYREEIQPKIEQVLTDFLTNFKDDEKFQDVVLTDQPSSGNGEKSSTFIIERLEKICFVFMSGEISRLTADIGLTFTTIQQKMDSRRIMNSVIFTGIKTPRRAG